MSQNNETNASSLKQSTLIIAVIVALLVGFYLGFMYATLRTAGQAPGQSGQSQMPPQSSAQMPGQDGQFADEIAALVVQTRNEPENAAAWTQLGNLYFDTGQAAKAVKAYEKSLALSPGDPNVLTDLGVMYRQLDQPQKAVECFDKAIEADPKHEIARFNKGTVLMHDLHDSEGALKAWEGLLAIDPDATAPNGQPIKDLVEGLKKSMTGPPLQ